MFREMRRNRQLLSKEETIEILKNCTSGVLGVLGDGDYPYTVPLSYVYKDGRLFFHCAKEGHKLDGIKRNDKVSFCVIEKDEVVPEKFATHYRSAVVFGRAKILIDDDARRAALGSLIEKYSPGYSEEGKREIERDWDRVCVVELKIEHMTGKTDIKGLQIKEEG